MAQPRFLGSPLGLFADELSAQTAAAPIAAAEEGRPIFGEETEPKSGVGKKSGLPSDPAIAKLFEAAARKYNVPVNVLLALGDKESGYNPLAVGRPTAEGDRAKGIMQYRDATAKALGIDPLDPAQAIDAAAKQYADRVAAGSAPIDAARAHFAGDDRALWKAKTDRYGLDVMRRAGEIGAAFQSSAAPKTADEMPGYQPFDLSKSVPGVDLSKPVPAEQGPGFIENAKDIGRSLKVGANIAAQDARELTSRIPVVGKPFVAGMDAIDRATHPAGVADVIAGRGAPADSNELLNRDNQAMAAAMTPQMQAALEKKWVTGSYKEGYGLGDAWKDPRAYIGGLVESMPEQALMVVPVMRLAKYAYATKLAAGATAEAASVFAAKTAAIAGSVTEGALGGAQSSRQVRDDINGMGDDVLQNSDAFKALVEGGATPDQAKQQLANDGATKAFLISGVATGMFGGAGDRVLAKIITEQASKSVIKRVFGGAARGVVSEGIGEELPQSAAQQAAQNYAEQQADPSIPLGRDVLNQGIGGAVLGAGQGGLQGGIGGGLNRGEQQQAPANPGAQPAAPTQTAAAQPSGPISKAVLAGVNSAVKNIQDAGAAAPRVTTTTAAGTVINGTLESRREDPKTGKWSARVLADDGQLHQFTDEDGVQLEAMPTAEPAGDTAAQLAAVKDPQAGKDAALITPQTAAADPALLEGLHKVQTPKGVFVTSNPQKAAQARAAAADGTLDDALMAKLLGYAVPKNQTDGTVVQARDAAGNMVHQELTNSESVEKSTANAKKMAPGAAVEVTDAESAQRERAAMAALDAELAGLGEEDIRGRMRAVAKRIQTEGFSKQLGRERARLELALQEAKKRGTGNALPAAAVAAPRGAEVAPPARAGAEAGGANDALDTASGSADTSAAALAVPGGRAAVSGQSAVAEQLPALTEENLTSVKKSSQAEPKIPESATAAMAAGDASPAAGLENVLRGPETADGGQNERSTATNKPAEQIGRSAASETAGAAEAERPVIKWFGTAEKAEGYVAKNNWQATHEVIHRNRQFQIVKRLAPEDPSKPVALGHEATKAQQKAGNYQKRHERVGGLEISVENEAGTSRKAGWVPLQHPYGYLKGTVGADKDHIDVFLGPQWADESNPVYVIDQTFADGRFDEAKAMMGFGSAEAARAGYLASYQKGWDRVGGLRKMEFAEFKAWATDPAKSKKPLSMAAKPAEQLTAAGNPKRTEAGFSIAASKEVERLQKLLDTIPANKAAPIDGARADIRGAIEQLRRPGGPVADVKGVLERASDRLLKAGHAPMATVVDEVVEAIYPEAKEAPKTTDNALAQFSGNTLFTADKVAAARARMKTKVGTLGSIGIDPELLADGLTITGAYIESGVRKFADYSKAMVADFGEAIRPYLRNFYNGIRDWPGLDTGDMDSAADVAEQHAAALKPSAAAASKRMSNTDLADAFYAEIAAGRMPNGNRALRELIQRLDGGIEAENDRLKVAQEALEAAIARRARELAAEGGGDQKTFDRLLSLYLSQPNLNIRTSTSMENQAYSTPAPLAFIADRLAGVTKKTKMYEPAAGNGMLTILAAPANATVNEMDDQRFENLKAQGLDAIHGDAMQAIESGAVRPGSQDAVVLNPPFGSIKDADGNTTKRAVDGYKLGQIDHLIAAEALRAMKDDGQATLIIGASKMPGGLSTDDRIFFNWLYGNYNVTSHFEVDGDLYQRQGAGWPVRVIAINGRAKSARVSPAAGTIERATNWEQVYGQFKNGLAAQQPAAESSTAERTGSAVSGPEADDAQRAANFAVDEAAGDGRRGSPGSAASAGDVGGQRAGVDGNRGAGAAKPVGQPDRSQRGDAAPSVGDRLGGEEPAAAADVAGDVSARSAGANSLAAEENQFQSSYTPRSSRKDEGVLIPVNMAQPTQDALSKLEDAVGDIDEYARDQLGYKSIDQLHDALMGLQVDSVASAIHQIGRGKAVVIADQTGIGKGRQAAAIIRWAQKAGKIPVFVTAKGQLFTDMYGDLADIGTKDIVPFILNSDEAISAAGGERLFANKPNKHRSNIEEIGRTGALPEGRNAVFMTYSQINTSNIQRAAISALAPKSVFVLDESHNAGGDSQTGEYVQSLLKDAAGVVYLSATYAKRPDNMPVYFKTDIGDAIGDAEGLMEAMAAGGLPLQTVVANNLVKAGQMFRRERSYDGVSIVTQVDTEHRAEHEKLSDSTTEALRAIVEADRKFHAIFVKQMDRELKAEGAMLKDIAGNQASKGVQHTEFSSVVHNFVRQMLLGLKAQTAADIAIAKIKAGEKPLIAVENTMGSFLSDFADAKNLRPGDPLGDFSYRNVLNRALERTRFIIIKDPQGNDERRHIQLNELDGITRAAYDEAKEIIDALDIDIPVSPIDWMRNQITQAGYTVAEITGRNLTVDYSGDEPMLAQLDPAEQKDKVGTTRKFNSGKLDALVLNVAGSTGISLHASEKFKDRRPRHMVIAQAAQDINIFMQMLGRIHRTGQVELPGYTILSADLPAEKRPTSLLSKKMKSLNANTSSNTESATSIKTADLLNKYGDSVVGNQLLDNPKLMVALMGYDSIISGEGKFIEDLARKATGRLALMPVETQREFYNEVEAQYQALIDYLNDTNQNELEPKTYDYDAREDEQQVIFAGENPESPFGEDAIYHRYSIKAQGKALTPAEIKEQMETNLEGKTPKTHADELAINLEGPYQSFLGRLSTDDQKQAAATTRTEAREFIQRHAIGSGFTLDINGDRYVAAVTNIRSTHKGSGNPYSMSKIQVTVALNGPLRSITIPATQFGGIEQGPVPRQDVVRSFENPREGRDIAKIITGNLLGAYSELIESKGTIINFSKADGTVEQGILLPRGFRIEANVRGDRRVKTGAEAMEVLKALPEKIQRLEGVISRDGNVRVTLDGAGRIVISVPKSKARGGKYFLDKKLVKLSGDFVSDGGYMDAKIADAARAERAIDAVLDKTSLYISAHNVEHLPPEPPKPTTKPPAPPVGPEGTPPRRFSVEQVDAARAEAMKPSGETLPAALKADPVLGAAIGRLLNSGAIKTRTTPPAGAPIGGTAWTDADGTINLSGAVPAALARPVLLHEAFHGRVRPLIGDAAWVSLMDGLAVLARRASRNDAGLGDVWTKAMENVAAARNQGDENLPSDPNIDDAMTAEEFGAYAVQNQDQMPAGVRQWVNDLLGAVKAWLLRRFGKQLGEITPEQLRALARESLLDAGNAQRQVARGQEEVRLYSVEQRNQAVNDAAEDVQNLEKQKDGSWRGRLDRDIGRFRALFHHPRHIAAIFSRFTPVYLTALDQFSARDRIVSDLNEDYQAYASLPQESKANVNKVLELGRLYGRVYDDEELNAVEHAGYRMATSYDDHGNPIRYRRPVHAVNSEAGEVLALNDAEKAAYHRLRAMFDRALDMFADQALEEMGYPELRGNHAGIKTLLEEMKASAPDAKLIGAAAFLETIEQAKRAGYVPFGRYGDYVVNVKRDKAKLVFVRAADDWIVRGMPHDQDGFMEEIGAVFDAVEGGWRIDAKMKKAIEAENSETVYSEKIETGLLDMLPEHRAKWLEGRARDIPSVKAAMERIGAQWATGDAVLQEPFRIDKRRPDAMVKLSDIDSLAQIANVSNEQWDDFRGKLADAIQSKSFRKHFFSSDNVPGYTGDFERSITDYMAGMAGYLARRQHQQRWDNAISAIRAERLHAYAQDYRAYANNPTEELQGLRHAGYLTYIAGSIASGVTNLTQQLTMTLPTLSQFANPAVVAAEWAKADAQVVAMLRLNRKVGLQLYDLSAAPADVRDALVRAGAEGDFIPQATFEIMATANQRNAGARRARRAFEKASQIFGLTFSVPEQANRLNAFITAYRLASRPGVREQIEKVYAGNQLAKRSMLGKNYSPYNVARYIVDDTQFRMGKTNRPKIARGYGAAIFQFKGFGWQSLEAWSRMIRSQGTRGKVAFALSMAAILALSGIWGLPGADDARKLLEALLKHFSERDVDLKAELAKKAYEETGSRWITDSVNHGAPFAAGLDMSRVGLGNIAPQNDSLVDLLGIPGDMFYTRPSKAIQQLEAGNYGAAALALAPKAIQNIGGAADMRISGAKNAKGQVQIAPNDITKVDMVQKALGWTPTQVTRTRDYVYSEYRMEQASNDLRQKMADKIVKAVAGIARTDDPLKQKDLSQDMQDAYRAVDEYNASADPAYQIQITNEMVNNRLTKELGGRKTSFGKEKGQARQGAADLREVYGVEEATP